MNDQGTGKAPGSRSRDFGSRHAASPRRCSEPCSTCSKLWDGERLEMLGVPSARAFRNPVGTLPIHRNYRFCKVLNYWNAGYRR